jgi:hypothetical protein
MSEKEIQANYLSVQEQYDQGRAGVSDVLAANPERGLINATSFTQAQNLLTSSDSWCDPAPFKHK